MPALVNALRQMTITRLAGYNDTVTASQTPTTTPGAALDISDYEGQIWCVLGAHATSSASTVDCIVQTSDDATFASGVTTAATFSTLTASAVAALGTTGGTTVAQAMDTQGLKRYVRFTLTANSTATPHWWLAASIVGVKQYIN